MNKTLRYYITEWRRICMYMTRLSLHEYIQSTLLCIKREKDSAYFSFLRLEHKVEKAAKRKEERRRRSQRQVICCSLIGLNLQRPREQHRRRRVPAADVLHTHTHSPLLLFFSFVGEGIKKRKRKTERKRENCCI